MNRFHYHLPGSLVEATRILSGDEDARILAGGQSLLPIMKQNLAAPTRLVDLGGIAELRGISVSRDSIVIGAMATHSSVASSPDVRAVLPGLAALAGMIGDTAVRNRGTIGGSVSYNDPAADYPAACLALDATVLTMDREIPARQFFVRPLETALLPAEIVIGIRLRIPARARYEKIKAPASRFAAVGVFVAQHQGEFRVALTGACPDGAIRLAAVERALAADFTIAAADAIDLEAAQLNSDLFADQEFRRHLVGVATRRAIGKLLQDPAADAVMRTVS